MGVRNIGLVSMLSAIAALLELGVVVVVLLLRGCGSWSS